MSFMEETKQFYQLIRPLQKQLFWLHFWKEIQLLLLGASIWLFGLYVSARFFVFPFIDRYFLIGAGIFLLISAFRIWKKRPAVKAAVLLFNQYIADDRVVVAFSFLDKDGEIEKLQLRDTIRHMKISEPIVLKRKKVWLYPKWATAFLIFAGVAILSSLFPNELMNEAKQAEKAKEIIDEVEKELAEKMEEAKEPQLKKALEEAKDTLAEIKDPQLALQEIEKLKKELELQAMKQQEKKAELEEIKKQAENSGLHDLAKLLEQADMKQLEEELKKLNANWDSLSDEQKDALTALTEQSKALTEEQMEQMLEQLKAALQSEELAKQLASASQQMQSLSQQLQQQMSVNGFPTQIAASSNPNSSTANQSSQNSSNQSNQSQGNGSSGNGQNSNGAGSGSGNGQGSGGQGRGGSGGGQGSGAGSGQGLREFLTIPERVGGKENIESDRGELSEGSSRQEKSSEAPVLRGNLRNYEEVYEQYGQSYRESTERMRLPADLTDIVKRYYEQLDPER